MRGRRNGLRAIVADDFELIADACPGAADGVSGELEDTARVEADFGDAERTDMLFDVDNPLLAIEEYKINRKHHAERVHAVAGNDPQAAAGAIPRARLAEQSDETAHVGIRGADFRGHEAIARFVVDVDFRSVIQDTSASILECPILFFTGSLKSGTYSPVLRLRRQIMIPKTTTASTPAMIRIVLTSIPPMYILL